jgi:hypothetical protein
VIVLSGRTRLADNEQQTQSDLQLVSCPDGVRGVAPRSSGLDQCSSGIEVGAGLPHGASSVPIWNA